MYISFYCLTTLVTTETITFNSDESCHIVLTAISFVCYYLLRMCL